MVSNLAKIDIVDVILGSSAMLSSKTNIQSALCTSNKPTSAEVKCSLSASLVNLKSVTNAYIAFSSINFAGMISEVKLRINQEYVFNQSILLNLDAQSTWYLNENIIDGMNLNSETIPSKNVLDAIIPPSSCFNITKQETLEKHQVSFSGIAKVLIYSGSGDRVVDYQLTNIANAMSTHADLFGGKLIKIPVSGYIEVNLIGAEQNSADPCLEV